MADLKNIERTKDASEDIHCVVDAEEEDGRYLKENKSNPKWDADLVSKERIECESAIDSESSMSREEEIILDIVCNEERRNARVSPDDAFRWRQMAERLGELAEGEEQDNTDNGFECRSEDCNREEEEA